jgi:hypothetical protein
MTDFSVDIPLSIAIAAHNGTSHVSDKRGEQEIASYASTLTSDLEWLKTFANTPEKLELLKSEFSRYRGGYRARFLARLTANSKCASTMITGRSGFNVNRARKSSDRADKVTTDLIEYRERALVSIRKKLTPELQPIMSGDRDAIERLMIKLAGLESAQETMTEANKVIRKHAKDGAEAQINALAELGFSEANARKILAPDFANRIGFPPHSLAYNGAEIRRVKERIEKLTTAKATDDLEVVGANARLVVASADNRVRLFFDGKPARETIDRLKAHAFRWTPSLGCWQGYINTRSVAFARTEAGVEG